MPDVTACPGPEIVQRVQRFQKAGRYEYMATFTVVICGPGSRTRRINGG